MMTIWANPDGVITDSPEGKLEFYQENKKISGYPNIYRTESFAYCPPERPENSDEAIYLSKEHLIGAIGFNQEYAQKIREINIEVLNGLINQEKIDQYIAELAPLIQELKLTDLKVEPRELAQSIVAGIIRNVIIDQMRRAELSFYQFNGWEIENFGDHPMNLKKTPDEAKETIEKIAQIINEDFIPEDVRKEFFQKDEF